MITEEEIERMKVEKENSYWQGYIQKQKEAMEICKICKYKEKVEQLETEKQNVMKDLEKIKDYMWEDQYVGRYYIEDIDRILSYMKGEEQ